eukprot:4018744-Amphidinium_carterae.1
METPFNDTLYRVYPIGAVINVNEKTPTTYKKLWTIIIDTGSAVSVKLCVQSHSVNMYHTNDRRNKKTIFGGCTRGVFAKGTPAIV